MILYVLSDKPISTKNVTEWLDSLGMSTYEPMFFANGFDSIDFLVCSSFWVFHKFLNNNDIYNLFDIFGL